MAMTVVPAARAQEPAPPAGPVIVATGTAVVQRAPDRAIIMAAAEAQAPSPRAAQQQAASRAAAVLERLQQAGVPKDAVRTRGYDLHQTYETSPSGQRVPKAYVARNTLEITLDQVARAGEIVDAVVQAGATAVDGIRFDLKDRDEAEREAIKQAVADARRRAEAAAAGAGAGLGRIVKIETIREESPRPFVMAGVAREAMQVTTPVEAGNIEVRARVTLTVEMK